MLSTNTSIYNKYLYLVRVLLGVLHFAEQLVCIMSYCVCVYFATIQTVLTVCLLTHHIIRLPIALHCPVCILSTGVLSSTFSTVYLSITSKNKNKPSEPENNDSTDINHSPVSEDEIAQHTQDDMKKEECVVGNQTALQTQDDMREEESLVGDQIALQTQDDTREEESLVGDQIALQTQDDTREEESLVGDQIALQTQDDTREEESLVGDQIPLHKQDDKREEIVPEGQIGPHTQDKREEESPEGEQDNRKEEESVFGLFWAPYAIGQTLNFGFISASISTHANLWVLLSLLVVGACLLLVAEVRYGEGYQCGLFHQRLLKQGCSIRTRLP